MNTTLPILTVLVVTLGLINLFRLSLMLIGSDIYNLRVKSKRNKPNDYLPKISVIIPAYNEQESVAKCLTSVFEADYNQEKLEVIVVCDGSTDKTLQVVESFRKQFNLSNLKVVTQPNLGKAHALNNGMKNHATGELVMCLDADSFLEKTAFQKVIKYFQDEKVMAVAANVKIAGAKGLLNLIQQFEYLICYQMKRAQSQYNIEYIIGGIGSAFRKSYLEKVGYYDANTVTEDIDLTMKILREGNKKVKVTYASDVVCYTQACVSIRDLIKQRSRWKWGRYQTFLKNKEMFFSSDENFTKGLSWFYLPFALWNDLTFVFEPIILVFIATISIIFRDPLILLSSLVVMTFYLIMNILAEDTVSLPSKIKMILISPLIYFLFFVLSYVEYVALVSSLIKLPTLRNSLSNNFNKWVSPKRVVAILAELSIKRNSTI